jgi:hypothetical protein
MKSRELELEQARKLLAQNLSEEARLVLLTQFPELKNDKSTK